MRALPPDNKIMFGVPQSCFLLWIESLPVLLGKLLEPLGNFRVFSKHIGRLVRVLLHIEK